MAQTKKKRRRKHRGTQGGSIDRRPSRGRARSRSEAQSRAKSRAKKRDPRAPSPPDWGTATKKGAIAAVLFVGLLALFGQPPIASLAIGLLMLGFYIPLAYQLDRFMYGRYQRKEAQKRAEREAQRTGAAPAKD